MKSGIYCIENLIDGKKYIGKGQDVEKRMFDSHEKCRYIYNAINRHGKENFKRYIIEYCKLQKLNEREQYYINKWNTKTPNGYNLTDGGEGMFNPSEETRKKLSDIATKRHSKYSFFGNHKHVYSPRSDEWKTSHRNQTLGKKLKNSSSKYYGVVKEIQNKKYVYWKIYVYIGKTGKQTKLKRYKTELEAAKAYDEYIIKNNLPNPLNFPQ